MPAHVRDCGFVEFLCVGRCGADFRAHIITGCGDQMVVRFEGSQPRTTMIDPGRGLAVACSPDCVQRWQERTACLCDAHERVN
jgi:hypothetical protein